MTNPEGFRQVLNQAEDNARKRDIKNQGELHNNNYTNLQEKQLGQALETLQDLTGNEYYIGRKRDPFIQVEFSQIIQANLRYLIKIGYLTNAERLLLLDLSCYVEIGTHVLVEKDVTNLDKDIINNASVTYLAGETYRTRHGLSKLMTNLRNKGILACAESGFTDETGRICTKRTWLVNPNIICASRKTSIDRITKHIFKDVLRNFKAEGSFEIHNLPIYFF